MILFFSVSLLGCKSTADNLPWKENLDEALKTAQLENKTVLVNFTGSDWCVWCKRLNEEVFSKPEFAEYAEKIADSIITLFETDSPMGAPVELVFSDIKLMKKVKKAPEESPVESEAEEEEDGEASVEIDDLLDDDANSADIDSDIDIDDD